MAQNLNPAIELLIAQIDELERKANAYKASVNVLCEKDGVPPIYPDDGGGGRRLNGQDHQEPVGVRPAAMGPDTFHGKPQQTAVRELLAIRRAANPTQGPAKPDEILAGLKAGGYVVQAKSDEIALVGLRAMLRKRNTIFYKLPNGTWGLREWYPGARTAAKGSSSAVPPASQTEGAVPNSDATDETETEAADTNDASAAA